VNRKAALKASTSVVGVMIACAFVIVGFLYNPFLALYAVCAAWMGYLTYVMWTIFYDQYDRHDRR
jgi:hypothetical protein